MLAREHGALADFLLALADFDRRRLWVEVLIHLTIELELRLARRVRAPAAGAERATT